MPAFFSNLVEFLFGGSKILVDDRDNVFDVRAVLNRTRINKIIYEMKFLRKMLTTQCSFKIKIKNV